MGLRGGPHAGDRSPKGASSEWIHCWRGCSRATTTASTPASPTTERSSGMRTSPIATPKGGAADPAVAAHEGGAVSDPRRRERSGGGRRAAKDLDWKRVLGVEADETPFHHTSLSVFRSRLIVNNADEAVLSATIERAVAAGLFAKKVLAITDSTGVWAPLRWPTSTGRTPPPGEASWGHWWRWPVSCWELRPPTLTAPRRRAPGANRRPGVETIPATGAGPASVTRRGLRHRSLSGIRKSNAAAGRRPHPARSFLPDRNDVVSIKEGNES